MAQAHSLSLLLGAAEAEYVVARNLIFRVADVGGVDVPCYEEEIDREEAEAEAAYNAGVQGSVIIGGAAGSGAGVAGSGAGVSGGGTIIIGGGAASAAASATAPAFEGAAQTVASGTQAVAGGTQTIAGATQTVVSPEAAQTAAAAGQDFHRSGFRLDYMG